MRIKFKQEEQINQNFINNLKGEGATRVEKKVHNLIKTHKKK